MTCRVSVPDYFEKFSCKCGDCRHPCCDGWGINIDEHEYFALIGLACGEKLRHKLDDAFVLREHPTPEVYASITPNWQGQCPMLDDDGLCLLQKEEGERVMPLICRVYPRAVKKYGEKHEICTSCSCEKTVELLMEDTLPLSLHETGLDLPFDGMEVYGDEPEYDRIRHAAIALMTNADLPIGKRIALLGELATGKEVRAGSDRGAALSALWAFVRRIVCVSESMALAAEGAASYFGDAEGEELLSLFDAAEAHLYAVVPDLEAVAGRIISNHLLYESFPFTPGTASPDDAFAAFCTAVGALKVLAVGGMAKSDKISDFVDLLAFANRFIEHSDFYKAVSTLEHPEGAETYAKFGAVFGRAPLS